MRRALCVLAIAAVSTMGATSHTVAAGGGEGCVDCSACWSEGQLGNKAWNGDETSVHERGGGTHSSCITTGGCSTQHPPECVPETSPGAALDALDSALSEGDVSTVERLLRESEGQFVVSSQRNAVQGLGCEGQIIAHIPLGDLSVAVDF